MLKTYHCLINWKKGLREWGHFLFVMVVNGPFPSPPIPTFLTLLMQISRGNKPSLKILMALFKNEHYEHSEEKIKNTKKKKMEK